MLRTFSVNQIYLRNNKSIRVKENTRYSGKNPAQAVKKVFTQYIKKCPKRTRVLHINLRESTHGSSDRVYRYEVRRVKLEKPVVRFPGTKKEFTIHNQISVKSLGIVKPKPLRKQTGSGDNVILDLLKHPSFQRFKSVPRKKGWDLVKEGVKQKCFSKDEKTRLRCFQAIGNTYGVKYTGTLAQFKLDQDWWKKTITPKFLNNLIGKSKIKYGRGPGDTDTEQSTQLKGWNTDENFDQDAVEVKNNGEDEASSDDNESENGEDEASSDDDESEVDDTNEMEEVYQSWSYAKLAAIVLFISITASMYTYWGKGGITQMESDIVNFFDNTPVPEGWVEGRCTFPDCRDFDINRCVNLDFLGPLCSWGTINDGKTLVNKFQNKNMNMASMRTTLYRLIYSIGGSSFFINWRNVLKNFDKDSTLMKQNLRNWVENVRKLMKEIWGNELKGWEYDRDRWFNKITAVKKIEGVKSRRLREALECIFLSHIKGKPEKAIDKFRELTGQPKDVVKTLKKGKGLRFFQNYMERLEKPRKKIEKDMDNLYKNLKFWNTDAIHLVMDVLNDTVKQKRENVERTTKSQKANTKEIDGENIERLKTGVQSLLKVVVDGSIAHLSGGPYAAGRALYVGIIHQIVNKIGHTDDAPTRLKQLEEALNKYGENQKKTKGLETVIKDVLPFAFPNEIERERFTQNIKLIRENKEGMEIMQKDFPEIYAKIKENLKMVGK